MKVELEFWTKYQCSPLDTPVTAQHHGGRGRGRVGTARLEGICPFCPLGTPNDGIGGRTKRLNINR